MRYKETSDERLLAELTYRNDTLETSDEMEYMRSALCAAINWGHKQDILLARHKEEIRKKWNIKTLW